MFGVLGVGCRNLEVQGLGFLGVGLESLALAFMLLILQVQRD